VSVMCRLLRVRRSGFYAWRSRPESQRSQTDTRLAVAVRSVFDESKGRYGSPRIHLELRATGQRVGRHRVARLMRVQRLQARKRRRFVSTTDSRHELPVAPNLVRRNFTASAPNEVWAGDVTFIATLEGWLYLAVLIDLFSRRIVGWAMSDKNDEQLTLSALEMAIDHRLRRPG
jgi:putative transposase